MNRFCTIISLALSVACFAFMFNSDIILSCFFGLCALMLCIIGFTIESKASYFWNTKLNKFLYYLSKNDKEYNITCKEFIYTCINNNEYKSEKNITLYPTCNNLDRIMERFAWSAPANKAIIDPLVPNQEICGFHQRELWTYYFVYFHHVCERHKIFKTGSVIHNLIDENNEAAPFLSATVDRKTKLLIMKVCFDNSIHPTNATFKVFSTKNPREEIYSEELSYDNVINGFSKIIDFPRQNWKYVISWEER